MTPILHHFAEATLYFGQAATYAVAWNASRRGGHAPSQVYLTVSAIYVALAVMLMTAPA